MLNISSVILLIYYAIFNYYTNLTYYINDCTRPYMRIDVFN